ncbi:MAG: endoglucanase, partial [Acidimicrobiales bacterium]|nr:endoglucanase [Acidimicrobiales bacterium]
DTTSTIGTVAITITNQAPVANAQTVAGNAPLTGTPITLTGSDPNGDPLTYAPTSTPTKGSVSCDDGACSYTAAAGKTGTDSFTFTATDLDGATSTATVTVNLDATTPGVYVGQVEYVEPESGNANLRAPAIPVTLTTASAAPVTIWYHTVDGTAVADGREGDYVRWGTPASPRSITIPAGQTTGHIQPPVLDDDLVEDTETFGVVISTTSGGPAYRGDSTSTVNIIDADTISTGAPILSVLDVHQSEGNIGTRAIGFRVLLSKAATAPVKLTCTPNAGTALPGSDYRAGAKTVTIKPGALSVTVDILGYTNTTPQPDRSFTLACALVAAPPVTIHDITASGFLYDED